MNISMNTLLAILKVTDARHEVILIRGLNHRFPWRHLPPAPVQNMAMIHYQLLFKCQSFRLFFYPVILSTIEWF